MAAAFTPDRESVAVRARELRARALELAEIELHAYEPVLEALRLPHDDPGRAERVRGRAGHRIAVAARDRRRRGRAGRAGGGLARTGNRNLAGDAIAGAVLGEAAAQAAARLVAINLTEGSAVSEATELARRAAAARETALS